MGAGVAFWISWILRSRPSCSPRQVDDCLSKNSWVMRPSSLSRYSVAKPFKNRLRNDQLPQEVGEFASEDFLARVRLRAFSPVAGAVVVHVLSLFQLADKQAAAVAAADQTSKGEIVLHLSRLVLGASIQQLLDALPTFVGHQRLVGARVRCAVPIKIASIQALSKDLVNDTAVELAATQLEALSIEFLHQRL